MTFLKQESKGKDDHEFINSLINKIGMTAKVDEQEIIQSQKIAF